MPRIESEQLPLLTRLREQIRRDGPLPVDRFMQICAADAEHGYWQRRGTIGADGDFITAPEISQVFGELIGLWCAAMWAGLGRPERLRLVELGPGRGTLMRDALRAGRVLPGFLQALSVHLVEISEPLRAMQRAELSAVGGEIDVHWHGGLEEVPEGPALVIANEFLDALPVRQLVYGGGVWRERVVGIDAAGDLGFTAAAPVAYQAHREPKDRDIAELRAGEEDVLAALARRSAPLVALVIDYGPAEPATGDTLQAVQRHRHVDPLATPGAADLTAHVHFAGLAAKAHAAGLAADGPITQAEFLGRLGIAERASRLMAANPAMAGEIEQGVQRLLSPTGMGQLFKAMAVRSRTLSPAVPFV
jgi:SAM-dependent MidA family methyltransferase